MVGIVFIKRRDGDLTGGFIKYKEFMEKNREKQNHPFPPNELHVSVDTGRIHDRVNLIDYESKNLLTNMDFKKLLRKSKTIPPTKSKEIIS